MHVTRRVLSMNVDGYGRRGRPKKRWLDECDESEFGNDV